MENQFHFLNVSAFRNVHACVLPHRKWFDEFVGPNPRTTMTQPLRYQGCPGMAQSGLSCGRIEPAKRLKLWRAGRFSWLSVDRFRKWNRKQKAIKTSPVIKKDMVVTLSAFWEHFGHILDGRMSTIEEMRLSVGPSELILTQFPIPTASTARISSAGLSLLNGSQNVEMLFPGPLKRDRAKRYLTKNGLAS
jgi:hypothetical protein